MPYLGATPTVFGVSGYSGAGTKSGNVPKITPEDLRHTVRPYALTDHIHEREAAYHLKNLAGRSPDAPFEIAFIPVVASWFQGIVSTLSAPLEEKMTAAQVKKLYEDRYADEKLLKWQTAVPEVADIMQKHGWIGGGVQVHSGGKRVVVVGVLDNLLKGAATQCVQASH